MLATEGHHRGCAFDAQFRFQRTRLVIDSGMNDAAVVSALMARYAIFFFHQQQAELGEGSAELHGGGKTNNSAADNHNVKALIGHLLSAPSIEDVENAANKINGKETQCEIWGEWSVSG